MDADFARVQAIIRGAVQGVGFRPFVYRLAVELGLRGFVSNSAAGVIIEAEGIRADLENLIARIQSGKPVGSFIQSCDVAFLPPLGFSDFEIRESSPGEPTALILPDLATCADCITDIFSTGNRRFRYPFTNCTHCGPRFSIIESLPYDRQNTSMKLFEMCPECRAEFTDPADRRFHAQPNACPRCGPQVELLDATGIPLAAGGEALHAAAEAIREGRIVALKGVGGFQILVDSRNDASVRLLRTRKCRPEKPFAVMFPNMAAVLRGCEVSDRERDLLISPQAPIVILRKRAPLDLGLAESTAPGNPNVGAFLAYSPLHHILMREFNFPVVATSGNLADEPLCTSNDEALRRLAGIADLFLMHNRPIFRHVDDSIARVMAGRCSILRRARGYAPLPVTLNESLPPLLAVGAHLKNTTAVSINNDVFLSQHIGDLGTLEAALVFERTIDSFTKLYTRKPAAIACDLHPDYTSTRYAENSGLPLITVQHHYAHVLSCMAEHNLRGEVLGFAWDGTGYGTDRTIWGGEALRITDYGFDRVCHFKPFSLPGVEKAASEPRRAAIGALYEIFGDVLFQRKDIAALNSMTLEELNVIRQMLSKRINTVRTSSAGRLFDAVASLLGLRQHSSYEGQASMELEFTISGNETDESYPFSIEEAAGTRVFDWSPMIRRIVLDRAESHPAGVISTRFHNTLTELIRSVSAALDAPRIVLTGGCFQNKYLLERTIRVLRNDGREVYWHRQVPPNDGGIALGQIVASARKLTIQ